MATKRLKSVQLPLMDAHDLPLDDEPVNGNGQKFRGQHQPQTTKNRTLNLDDLIRAAHDLSDAELQQLQEAIAILLEIRSLGDKDEVQIPQACTLNSGIGIRGSIEEKRINGCGPYRYLRRWSNGKHKSTYLEKVKEERSL
jgi:hypothetical protein